MSARLRARLHGEAARHPREFAFCAAGDVVVGDGVANRDLQNHTHQNNLLKSK